jgi:type VI secretion system protein ImpA
MPFDRALLLAPVSAAEPCGPALNTLPLYDEFRAFSNSSERPDWGKYADRAYKLARESRDLRAWVWLTRTSICVEGIIGLASGLELIADGLEQYWDVLPPQHANENDPAERFMMRLSTLTQLGATHYSCSLDDLRRFGRSFTDLQADLNEMISKVTPDVAIKTAAEQARDAANRICGIFARGFGSGRDPLLNFETIVVKLAAVEARFDPPATQVGPTATSTDLPPVSNLVSVRSRQEVIRAIDLILDYYSNNEPSSPVPLLVARARRLVSMSFVDAIKDLAPGGLKDLLLVAGSTEERK